MRSKNNAVVQPLVVQHHDGEMTRSSSSSPNAVRRSVARLSYACGALPGLTNAIVPGPG